jgi:hypothetical protein
MEKKHIWLHIVLICLASNLASLAGQTPIKPGVYNMGTNGTYFTVTNIEAMWAGVWEADTNGWRVQLSFWNTNSSDVWASIAIGNTTTNLGGGYVWTPNEKYSVFELTDSNGIIILPKNGITLGGEFPSQMPARAFPKWPDGKLKNRMGFFTNSPPWVLKQFSFCDIYQVRNEGDYTLAVCVTIYKTGTNSEHLFRRIDLPCVNTKIHLKPCQK